MFTWRAEGKDGALWLWDDVPHSLTGGDFPLGVSIGPSPCLLKPDAHGPTAAWPWAFLADACTTRPFNSSLLCVPDAIN